MGYYHLFGMNVEPAFDLKATWPERGHSNQMTINFEHETLFIDASAELVSVNHVPQDFAKFAEGTTAVSSVDQLLAAMDNGTPPTSTAQTAVAATEALMAAYTSIVEGRTVALPLESGTNRLARKW